MVKPVLSINCLAKGDNDMPSLGFKLMTYLSRVRHTTNLSYGACKQHEILVNQSVAKVRQACTVAWYSWSTYCFNTRDFHRPDLRQPIVPFPIQK